MAPAYSSRRSAPAGAANLASGQKLEVRVDPKKLDVETAALWQRFGGWMRTTGLLKKAIPGTAVVDVSFLPARCR